MCPMPTFSSYTNSAKLGVVRSKDKRWSLLYSFAKQIKFAKPDIITMENVPRVVNHKVFKDFIKSLKMMAILFGMGWCFVQTMEWHKVVQD